MSSTPRVSIIMSVYNGEEFLDEAVRSVVAQTFTDWELVLVNDGSTDRTGALADLWASKDPRVRVVHQPNSGKPAAGRNRGMRAARGSIIAFLDGDDLWHPERLARSVVVLDAYPEVGSVFHDYRWFVTGSDPEQGRAYLADEKYVTRAAGALTERSAGGHPVWIGNGDLIKFMSTEIVGIHTSAISVRRAVLDSLEPPGFREELPHCEDIDLWLRISRATTSAVSPAPLSYYRHTTSSWMVNNPLARLVTGSFTVKSDMLLRLERMLTPAEWPSYREKISRYWCGLGYLCLTAGLASQARYCYRQAWRTGKERGSLLKAAKGLMVSSLPRPLLEAWWKVTGGGYSGRSKGPSA
ncbi:MAG TPA: glycosyltransferase family 2 protein [Gemmatimonadales bacterium]|nr:glycosyltransferase family 2 protein [Gemmatimonadales bacterium]